MSERKWGGLGAIWRRRGPWLRGAVSVLLLALVLHFVDVGDAWRLTRQADPLLLLLLGALLLGERLLAAYRWFILLRAKNRSISFGAVVGVTFISVFLGSLMPGGVGPEVVRIYLLTRATADLALAFSSVLLERTLALLALLLLVIVGLLLAPAGLPPALGYAAWLGLVLLGLAGLMVMHPAARRATSRLLAPSWFLPVRRRLAKLYAQLDDYARWPGLMAWATVLALALQLLRVLITAIGAWALHVHLPLLTFVVIVPVIILVSLIPISIAGLGVRESAHVTLLGLVGVDAEAAFTLSLLIYLLGLATTLPGALLLARGGGPAALGKPIHDAAAAQPAAPTGSRGSAPV